MRFSVLRSLTGPVNGRGDRAVRLRVTWAGVRCDLRSGYCVPPAAWDAGLCCMRAGAVNGYGQTATEVNGGLMWLEEKVGEVLSDWERTHGRGAAPSPVQFKQAFEIATGRRRAPARDFFGAWEEFVRTMSMRNGWSAAVLARYASLRVHLLNWRARVSLDAFTADDFDQWVRYLLGRGLMNSTVSKSVDFVRRFLRWCADMGYYSGDAHLTYKPRFKGIGAGELVYLSWEEVQLFLNFDFSGRGASGRTLSDVRDVFCFCCFTGLRYSDVAKLRRADVHLSDGAAPYISVITQKTCDTLRVELNKYALAILERHASADAVEARGGLALPVLTNQKMNIRLRDAARVAGLNEEVRRVRWRGSVRQEEVLPKWAALSSHAARRTFIIIALRLGIPVPVIMEWTGHSDYDAMKPYIKIVDEARREGMSRFDAFGADASDND